MIKIIINSQKQKRQIALVEDGKLAEYYEDELEES